MKEQYLTVKEKQLNDREKEIDSSKSIIKDSLDVENTKIPGTWLVEMQCTQTTCSRSSVGDIKNEQWEIKFQDNIVIASAMSV